MALLNVWRSSVATDPTILAVAVEQGIQKLGYERIKPEQLRAVQAALRGEHVFVSVPTGFGKSLVYQLLPFCAESLLRSSGCAEPLTPIVVVVSPLLSLMHDQVTKLAERGVKAICISGESEAASKDVAILVEEGVTHVFGSPEAFVGSKKWRALFMDDTFARRIVAVAVDEAHCIVKWGMGEEFRAWYGQVSQLRSLLPSGLPVLALTANATQHVKNSIVQNLQLTPVHYVVLSPNRPNIRYSVQTVSRDVHTTFRWLLLKLKAKRTDLPKVIVFCRSINTCASLYKMFITELKEESYQPTGCTPDISKRLFAMYHARIADDEKHQIMESIMTPTGNCRVLFCTTAFGMGVDVSNIRTVIHFGPTADVDDYFQESGRAGRDGIESNAILYYYPGCLVGHVSKVMKEYCKLEDQCRRKELLKHLIGRMDVSVLSDTKHNCCDVCTKTCNCTTECPFTVSTINSDVEEDEEQPVREVSQHERHQLRQRLEEFGARICQSAQDQCEGQPVYAGLDFVCGLPSSMVDTVVENCEYIADSFDVEEKCLLWNCAGDIYRIIEEVLD